MILNPETFRRVAELTGYERATYYGASPNPGGEGLLTLFLVYDGERYWEPTRARFVWVDEQFQIRREDDHKYSVMEEGDESPRLVVTPR